MSNDNAGRTPRRSGGGSPMGSTVAIVVTIVAVVLAVLIFKRMSDDNSSTTPAVTTHPPTTLGPKDTGSPVTDAVTTTSLQKTGTKVQVANSSHQQKVAAAMSTELQKQGFSMATAINGTTKLTKSKVLYDPSKPEAKPVADSVAAILGGLAVEAGPTPLPVQTTAWASGSSVILLLGDDLAGKTIASITGKVTGVTVAPTTAAGGKVTPTT
jgi:hypothetical protein